MVFMNLLYNNNYETTIEICLINNKKTSSKPLVETIFEPYLIFVTAKLGNVLVSQLVLAAALVFVYLIKGFDVMRRLLPLYIVLCVLTAAYFFVDALAHRDGN